MPSDKKEEKIQKETTADLPLHLLKEIISPPQAVICMRASLKECRRHIEFAKKYARHVGDEKAVDALTGALTLVSKQVERFEPENL